MLFMEIIAVYSENYMKSINVAKDYCTCSFQWISALRRIKYELGRLLFHVGVVQATRRFNTPFRP
jgi:hypothetical protein